MTARKHKLYTLPILVFVMGVVVSFCLLLWLIRLEKDKIAHDFARLASDRSAVVAQRLQEDFAIPESVRQLFDASDFVDGNEFTTYVAPMLHRTPELDSVVWSLLVRGGEGRMMYPVLYAAPPSESELMKGMKLETYPGLNTAIEASIKTNSASWSHPSLDAAQSSARWLVVIPVRPHDEATVGDLPSGILVAKFDLHRLLTEAFSKLEKVGLDVVIYDGRMEDDHILERWDSVTRATAYDPVKEEAASQYAYTRNVRVGAGEWIIYCRPAPWFLARYSWGEQVLIFVGCLLLSGLVAVYILRQRVSETELLDQNQKVKLLENVAVVANEAPSNHELLKNSLQLICQSLNWPFGHVYVADQETPDVLVSSGIFQMDDPRRFEAMCRQTKVLQFAMGEGLPGKVAQAGRPIFIPDVQDFGQFPRRKSTDEAGLYSCFAFPVVVRKKVVVVVEFFHTQVMEPFSGWEELLMSMSTQMSHAMERRLAGDELLEKAAVLENAAEGIARVDVAGIYLTVNKAYARMCGVSARELVGTNRRKLVHPEDETLFSAAYLQMLMNGRAEVTVRHLRQDGAVYHQEMTIIRDLDRMDNFRGCYFFSRDVTEREEQQRALQESEERFMAFMNNNPASASIKDENSRLLYINPASTEQFGFTYESAVGKTPEDLTSPEAAKVIRESDQALLATNKPVNLIEIIPNRDGDLKHWQVYKFPMKSKNGKRLIGVLCFDVTERLAAEEAIIVARDEALESARMKSQFLANMSHEIRTPMNGLIGMLGLMGRSELPAKEKELLQTATGAADSLLRLLNDILDFSKIDAGKMEIDPVVFDPRQCVRHAVKILAETAHKKGLSISHEVADDVPQQLIGDSGRLAQIVVNLVNNGIKFTHQGSVTASLAVDERMEDGWLLLHGIVRDTGIGVPESHRELIFQPFRQSDSSTARQFGGTGLGLAICSQLVELMGGKIWIENEPSGGSAFHFTMQMRETAERPPAALATKTILPKAEHSLRILLAEDNAINQLLAITLLEERGHQVTLARDGHEAVALFQKGHFDLILMDVQMPGKDGYETTGDIRKTPRGKTIPIYAVTAHAMPEDRRRCLEVGMNDYLTKPIRVDEFARLVESKVERNQTIPRPVDMAQAIKTRLIGWQPQRIAPAKKPTPPAQKSFDLNALREMVDNDEDLVLELATLFTEQAAVDRGQLQTALQKRDATQLQQCAHRLKGSAMGLSAKPLADILQTIESSGRNQDFAGADEVWQDFETACDTLVADLGALHRG